jgi:hypothetical protein
VKTSMADVWVAAAAKPLVQHSKHTDANGPPLADQSRGRAADLAAW